MAGMCRLFVKDVHVFKSLTVESKQTKNTKLFHACLVHLCLTIGLNRLIKSLY